MRVTVHPDTLRRYEVICHPRGPQHPAVQSEPVSVLVFASDGKQARVAAVDKLRGKWRDHRGIDTNWIARTCRLA